MASGSEDRLLRDRFLGFSFAASDFVFEVDVAGLIAFSSGAARKLTGHSVQELIGSPWLELFHGDDRARLDGIVAGLESASRSGPIAARMAGKAESPLRVVFSACRLPHRPGFAYCALSASRSVIAREGGTRHPDRPGGLLDSKSFSRMAGEALEASSALGGSVDMTLLDIGSEGAGEDGLGQDSLGKRRHEEFMSDLGSTLRSHAVGGELAGQMGAGKFGVLHDQSVDGEEIERSVRELIQAFAEDPESVTCGRNTVKLDSNGLTQEEAAQALVYTINLFASAGDSKVTIKALRDGFKGLAKQTRTQIESLKSTVAARKFELYMQPVVVLASEQVKHYELLLRFRKGQSPYAMVSFAEGVGLIQDLDMAVMVRALELLTKGSADPALTVAANVSGRSLANPRFVDDLSALLTAHKALNRRLMIEVTESAEIADLASVNQVILALRKVGFAVGLDDFGAGAASFQYLRALEVDFVKLDGTYVQRVVEVERDRLMLKAMAELCRTLGISTVGEMIETREQAAELLSLGIDHGQGYLFGRPALPADFGIAPPAAPKKATRAADLVQQRFDPMTGAQIFPG